MGGVGSAAVEGVSYGGMECGTVVVTRGLEIFHIPRIGLIFGCHFCRLDRTTSQTISWLAALDSLQYQLSVELLRVPRLVWYRTFDMMKKRYLLMI